MDYYKIYCIISYIIVVFSIVKDHRPLMDTFFSPEINEPQRVMFFLLVIMMLLFAPITIILYCGLKIVGCVLKFLRKNRKIMLSVEDTMTVYQERL